MSRVNDIMPRQKLNTFGYNRFIVVDWIITTILIFLTISRPFWAPRRKLTSF